MKIKTLGLGIAALVATVSLSACGVEVIDDGLPPVPARTTVVSASTTTTVSHDHGWHDDGWSDNSDACDCSFGGDYGYGDGYGSRDTTVITQTTTPVVVDQPTVVEQPAVVAQPQPAANGSIDPIINSFTANPGNDAKPGQPITFTVVASDPNHDPLQFNWSATGGLLSTNTGRVVTWTPPSTPGIYTVSTIITNGQGGAATGSQNLVVAADGSINTSVAAAPAAAPAQVATARK